MSQLLPIHTPASEAAEEIRSWRQRVVELMNELPSARGEDGYDPAKDLFVHRLVRHVLDTLVNDLEASLAGVCPEQPGLLAGQPMSQYHCPTCGCMVVAGLSTHPHDDGCWLGLDPLGASNE